MNILIIIMSQNKLYEKSIINSVGGKTQIIKNVI